MRVTGEPGGVILDIDAPDGAELVVSKLVDAFGDLVTAAAVPR